MDIVLIYPPNSELISRIPLGLMTIEAYLTQHSTHHTKVVDLATYIKNGSIALNIDIYKNCADFLLEHFPCDVFAFSAVVTGEIPALQIAKEIKLKNPMSTIIFGNQWASANDLEILKYFPQIDYIVNGEGEETFHELLDQIACEGDLSLVKGISYRENGFPVKTKNRPLMCDLDKIPSINTNHLYPAIHEFSSSPYGGHYGVLEFGRGCPFACSFCSTTIHWRRRVRTYSIERTINDMTHLKSLGFDFVEFTYDNFGTKRNELIEFCNSILKVKLEMKWSIRCRLDFLDFEIIKLLKSAGCTSVLVGLESGAQSIIDGIGKSLDFTKSLKTVGLLIVEGIQVCGSYVTGLAMETKENVLQTLYMAAILRSFGKLVASEIHFLTPLPGTPETLEAIQNGNLMFHKNPYVSPDFSRNLEWLRLANESTQHSNPRLKDDQRLIDSYPRLFTTYGYIHNPNVSPERFAAMASYLNLLLQFYPLTIASILNICKSRQIDFIEDFENYAISRNLDRLTLLTFRVEIKSQIDIGCSDKTKVLLDVFQSYFCALFNIPKPVYDIFKYETTLIRLSQEGQENLIKRNVTTCTLNADSILKKLVYLEIFDYPILKILKKIRNDFVDGVESIEWDEFNKQKTFLCFEPLEESSKGYYAGLKIHEISKTVFNLLESMNGEHSIKTLVALLFENMDEMDINAGVEQVVPFLKQHQSFFEVSR